MTKNQIKKALEDVFFHDKKMDYDLYKRELEEGLPHIEKSMRIANDDYIFALIFDKYRVIWTIAAMVLIEKSGTVHINEAARVKLREFCNENYQASIELILPGFVQKLQDQQIPMMGAKKSVSQIIRNTQHERKRHQKSS